MSMDQELERANSEKALSKPKSAPAPPSVRRKSENTEHDVGTSSSSSVTTTTKVSRSPNTPKKVSLSLPHPPKYTKEETKPLTKPEFEEMRDILVHVLPHNHTELANSILDGMESDPFSNNQVTLFRIKPKSRFGMKRKVTQKRFPDRNAPTAIDSPPSVVLTKSNGGNDSGSKRGKDKRMSLPGVLSTKKRKLDTFLRENKPIYNVLIEEKLRAKLAKSLGKHRKLAVSYVKQESVVSDLIRYCICKDLTLESAVLCHWAYVLLTTDNAAVIDSVCSDTKHLGNLFNFTTKDYWLGSKEKSVLDRITSAHLKLCEIPNNLNYICRVLRFLFGARPKLMIEYLFTRDDQFLSDFCESLQYTDAALLLIDLAAADDKVVAENGKSKPGWLESRHVFPRLAQLLVAKPAQYISSITGFIEAIGSVSNPTLLGNFTEAFSPTAVIPTVVAAVANPNITSDALTMFVNLRRLYLKGVKSSYVSFLDTLGKLSQAGVFKSMFRSSSSSLESAKMGKATPVKPLPSIASTRGVRPAPSQSDLFPETVSSIQLPDARAPLARESESETSSDDTESEAPLTPVSVKPNTTHTTPTNNSGTTNTVTTTTTPLSSSNGSNSTKTGTTPRKSSTTPSTATDTSNTNNQTPSNSWPIVRRSQSTSSSKDLVKANSPSLAIPNLNSSLAANSPDCNDGTTALVSFHALTLITVLLTKDYFLPPAETSLEAIIELTFERKNRSVFASLATRLIVYISTTQLTAALLSDLIDRHRLLERIQETYDESKKHNQHHGFLRVMASNIPDDRKTKEFRKFEGKLLQVPPENPDLKLTPELLKEKSKQSVNFVRAAD